MNIYISNLDTETTKDQLKDLLTPALRRFKIEVFDLRKRKGNAIAFLAVPDVARGRALLNHAAQNTGIVKCPSGRCAKLSKGHKAVDSTVLSVLQQAEKGLPGCPKMAKQNFDTDRNGEENNVFEISALECGRWETTTGSTTFVPYYISTCHGTVKRDGRELKISLDTAGSRKHYLVPGLSSIVSSSVSRIKTARTLIVNLALAPKFFEEMTDTRSTPSELDNIFPTLSLDDQERYRVSGLPGTAPLVTGSCLSYRLTFKRNIADFQKSMQQLMSYQVLPKRTPNLATRSNVNSFQNQVTRLNDVVSEYECSFGWKFQIQALWSNGVLSPVEVQQIIPAMHETRERLGDTALIKILQRMTLQLPPIDASTDARSGGLQGALTAMREQEEYLLQGGLGKCSKRDEVTVHRVLVTPTGIYLSGPEQVAANRVLRQYRAHQDCFIRVVFADEDEGRLEFAGEFSNEKILKGRFLTILRRGLDIASEHFDFLGFSHSSLRSQTCWFMRPFVHDGSLMFARRLISLLGDFTTIYNPAKCAARIGQAFSETTSAVQIDSSVVKTFADVKAGRYMFTDGCGSISREMWRILLGGSSSTLHPTSFQIRYKGAKGMLSLDSRLDGLQMRLRESMVKFEESPADTIEICNTNSRPLPFKLNRQMIKILEDLGIPATTFETLQEQAIQKLRSSARSTKSAIDYMNVQLSDSSTGLPTLLKCVQKIGIDIAEDNFLRDVLGALLQTQLRQIKYRTRIPVPDAVTLYGISDETGLLREGEVFVTFDAEDLESQQYLNGRVAVTRSPALHPGDIQHAQAIIPPEGSSLRDLRNCIVFSQQGKRDLPSMLSGGDLDGDIYNIIYDEDLIPEKVMAPAQYLPAEAVNIGRTVTSNDITEFFVNFMENDQLGRIATLHQVLADAGSTKSNECISLAKLHSSAVDFSKSGVPVRNNQIPKYPPYRPDFMAPSASTKVEKGITRPMDLIPLHGRQRYTHYESDRILGKLYRAVNEDIFFQELEDDTASIFSNEAKDTALGEILKWVERQIDPTRMEGYAEVAIEARNYYEMTVLEIMSRYTTHNGDLLTEKEVFTGTILGRTGAASRWQRQQSDYMRSHFNLEVRELKSWMERQAAVDEENFLHLAAACLRHAVIERSNVDQNLYSFAWIAAAMCVPALFDRTEGTVVK